MPTLKLTSFDMKGLAESIRLAFYIGDIPFEDNRIKFDTWKDLKSTVPFGQLPVLEINGDIVTQSSALLHYAGTMAKIYPAGDPMQALKVDEIVGMVGDLRWKIAGSIHEEDEARKTALRKKLAEDIIPTWAANVEKHLTSRGLNEFMAGKSLTIADLEFMNTLVWVQSGILDGIPTDIFAKYPTIMKIHQNICNDAKIKAYYASRA